MKKLFLVLSLLFAANVYAASFDLGNVDPSVPFSNFVEGEFSDEYKFTTPEIKEITVSVTNVSVGGAGEIRDFGATIDGQALEFVSDTFGNALAKFLVGTGDPVTSHTLTVTGTAPAAGASYGGSISITQSAVPVPAAAWLFGSALVGFFNVRRRG